ncbi:hypothetical protein FNL39_11483 [Nocardia caishijiensis]|uniref:Uncharacterized protein n=2 Tax=Nocardia caishijiensis TaxID=184756 RepID=A0ABQ6YFU4_9NOCA|nr:hypothetical protein FNL39_11483 [Nocardia caishijiensis]
MHPSLHSLGNRDPLAYMQRIADAAPKYLDRADAAYKDLEHTWSIENPARCRPGLRELILHLSATNVPVVFASIKHESVARNSIRTGLKLASGYSVIGRSGYRNTPEAYKASVIEACDTLPDGARTLVIAHEKIASHDDFEEIAPNLIKVSSGKYFVGTDAGGSEEYPPIDILDLALQCDLTQSEASELKKAKSVRDRVYALMKKARDSGLTSAEFAEYGDLTGGLTVVGNTAEFGFIDEKVGQHNAKRIEFTRSHAAHGQHLLEVVSIDAALIEIELRNWLIIHRSRGFQATERITFGQTVTLAQNNGFHGDLIVRLRKFNSLRNDAVHRLARGVETYENLTIEYMRDCVLLFDIRDFVLASAPRIGVETDVFYD